LKYKLLEKLLLALDVVIPIVELPTTVLPGFSKNVLVSTYAIEWKEIELDLEVLVSKEGEKTSPWSMARTNRK